MPRKKGGAWQLALKSNDPDGMAVWARRYAAYQRIRHYSERTVATAEAAIGRFIAWAAERGIHRPREVTIGVLESYQRFLYYYRKSSGRPLGASTQHQRLQNLRGFFRFLVRERVIDANPASELELPRRPHTLPRAILSEREIEILLSLPDVSDALGLRDRAMMEVFYATGIRRFELAGLDLFDVDAERATVVVRLGKGKKDRVVPVGERALHWLGRYLEEARRGLIVGIDHGILFVSERGERLTLSELTQCMRVYLKRAKLGKTGACHIFRHSMATHMLEAGADVRIIQELLGHAKMSTTEIYTHVSIQHLKSVYAATHPAAKLAPSANGPSAAAPSCALASPPPSAAELLAELSMEADDEHADAL